jgi:isopenicillin-N epimerase
VQKDLAAYLGVDPHDLFLRGNVTAAFNDFLFALPELGEGELVATGWEYGGIVGVARQWAKVRGMDFRLAPLAVRPEWTSAELAAAVAASLGPRTRVLLLSHVATATGALLPITEIALEAQKRGVITVVDGAHAVGALPFRIDALEGVDFYGGNFHKWFLGPEGTGFGWVAPRWKEKLLWKFGGWAHERPPPFYQGFGEGVAETCRRFFPGTIDRIPFLGLGEVLAFWEEHGHQRLRARQRALLDLVAAEVEALGWERLSPREASLLGPLVSFRRPAAWQGEATVLATRLYQEAKVQLALPVVQDIPLVRFSPGVYAGEEEIREAIRRLQHWRP